MWSRSHSDVPLCIQVVELSYTNFSQVISVDLTLQRLLGG